MRRSASSTEFLCVAGVSVSLRCDHLTGLDDPPDASLVPHDFSVRRDMSDGRRGVDNLCQVREATDGLKLVPVSKDCTDGLNVHRRTLAVEFDGNVVEPSVRRGVEWLARGQDFQYVIEGVFVGENRAEHRGLGIGVVRRNSARDVHRLNARLKAFRRHRQPRPLES
jgi:hypothetical protein